jgi:hypothetical protein
MRCLESLMTLCGRWPHESVEELLNAGIRKPAYYKTWDRPAALTLPRAEPGSQTLWQRARAGGTEGRCPRMPRIIWGRWP